MSFQPFPGELAESRLIEIPADLDDASRARFVSAVKKAVQKQAELASRCGAILELAGDVEEDAGVLRIPHEPATPTDATAVLDAEERPDLDTLRWLTWSLSQALSAAHAGMVIHGSLQNGSLFLDSMGRLKLGDFGIGPVFELICGGPARRYLSCDAGVSTDETGRLLSGRWVLLPEDARREFGWIAPYFPHELLEDDDTRLNVKSDQFGLGTLLFLWATGSHPYGASLGDPTLNFYFHLEPFALDEERTEWSEHFERRRGGVATSADEPVLAWAKLVEQTLSSDSGDRFSDLGEVLSALRDVPPSWAAALEAIGAATPLLSDGRPEEFLTKIGPLGDDETLPEIWRERLARRLSKVEKEKGVIVRRRELAALLEKADELLADGKIREARAEAEAVLASEDCDDALRRRAEKLLEWCAEQDRIGEEANEALAQVAFDSAREALGRGDFGDALLCLSQVVEEQGYTAEHVEQAQQLRAEIQESEDRFKRCSAELSTAREEFERAEYQAAAARLESLLTEPDLMAALETPARELLEKTQSRQQLAAEYEEMLQSAELAWEQADLEAIQSLLAGVPAAVDIPRIAEQHEALTARCEGLRAALEAKRAAELALAAGDAGAALAKADEVLQVGQYPESVGGELSELRARCATMLEEQHRAAVEWAIQGLQEARQTYEGGDAEGCRQQVESVVQQADFVSDEVRATADELLAACGRLAAAGALLDEVTRLLSDDDLEGAQRRLAELPQDDLPETIVQRGADLVDQIRQAQKDHAERQLLRLRAQLDDAEQKVAAGELAAVEPILAAVEESTLSSEDMIGRVVEIRGRLAELLPIAATLAAAETEVRAGAAGQAGKLLAQGGPSAGVAVLPLPAELPNWAEQRAAELRRQIAEVEERHREEAIAAARSALDAAEQALAAGDPAAARPQLERAGQTLELDPELAPRHEALSKLAGELEQWLPKVQAAEADLKQGEFAKAYTQAEKLLKAEGIPEPVEQRLKAVRKEAKKRIAARQQEIAADLAALGQTLERRGRRAKTLPRQIESLRADPLASKDQRQEAAKLLERFEALPPLRRSPVPMVAALVAVAGLAGGGAWMFWPQGDTPPVTPPATPPVARTDNPPAQPDPDPVVEPPVDPVAEPPVVVTIEFPGTISMAQTWLDLVGARSESLPAVLAVFSEAAGRPVAFGEVPQDAWQIGEDDPGRGMQFVTVITDFGDVSVKVEARTADEGQTWTFVATLDDAELSPIASWVRDRMAARVDELNVQGQSDEARSSCQRFAAQLGEVTGEDWARGLQLALACPEEEPPIAAWPTRVEGTWRLAELVAEHSAGMGQLLGGLTDEARQPLQLPDLHAGGWIDDGARYEDMVTVATIVGELNLSIAGVRGESSDRWTWQVGLSPDALSTVSQWVDERVAGELTALADGGRVAAVWRRYDEVRVLLDGAGGGPRLEGVESVVAEMPPKWDAAGLPEGYQAAGELHPNSGYPESLTDADGRTLLLVYLHPNDALWGTMGESADQYSWQVFYIDAQEAQGTTDQFNAARDQAGNQYGREIPERSEWMQAALVLRDNEDAQNLVGGRYEWCTDENGEAWVCGGCDLDNDVGLFPPVPPGADAASFWEWLGGGLVSQQREHGDGLTTYRTVLRVFPGIQ